ncbi:MAG: PEGA domain-containing protein [Bacteroidota bacterium]
MKKIIFYLLFSSLLFITSCATLLTGRKQKVSIDSNPQGAEVIIDGQKLGVTPAKVKVDRELDALLNGGKSIQLNLNGYRNLGYELDTKFNLVSIINHFNPLFWGIDIVSGAVTKYDNHYIFELMPLEDNASASMKKGREDKYDKLIKLKKLLDDGIITEEEYEEEKAKILED